MFMCAPVWRMCHLPQNAPWELNQSDLALASDALEYVGMATWIKKKRGWPKIASPSTYRSHTPIDALLVSEMQTYLCDTQFKNKSRGACAIPHYQKQAWKSFAALSLKILCDLTAISLVLGLLHPSAKGGGKRIPKSDKILTEISQEVSKYGFTYGSKLRKCHFEVDSYLGTPTSKAIASKLFQDKSLSTLSEYHSEGVLSTVEEVVWVHFCCFLS